MANASRDENSRTTVICASSTDGLTIVPVCAKANHSLCVDDDTTGIDNGNNEGNAMLDENSVSVWIAESSDGSGDIVEVYADPVSKKVLINSN